MAATRTEAKDAMFAIVKAVVDVESLHAVYEDTDPGNSDQKPDSSVNWVRVQIRHRAGASTSLSSPGGIQRHQVDGFILVEIFTVPGDGNVSADYLAQEFEDAFREVSPHDQTVWFTDVYSQEVGNTDGWFKTNMVAEFHYDIFR